MAGEKPFYAFKSSTYMYRPTGNVNPNGTPSYQKGVYKLNKSKEINYNYFKSAILINGLLKNGIQHMDFNPSVPDGLYTWIVKQSGNFYTAKIIEGQEIGTLHNNIVVLTHDEDKTKVIAAGEIEKIGNSIKFNFVSGTYMKSITINDNLISKIKHLLQSFGFTNIIYMEDPTETFINLENNRLKPLKNRTNKLNTMYSWNPLGGKRYTKKYKVKRRKTHKNTKKYL